MQALAKTYKEIFGAKGLISNEDFVFSHLTLMGRQVENYGNMRNFLVSYSLALVCQRDRKPGLPTWRKPAGSKPGSGCGGRGWTLLPGKRGSSGYLGC